MELWVKSKTEWRSGFRVETFKDQRSLDVMVELHQSGRLAGFTRVRRPDDDAVVEKRMEALITEVVGQKNGGTNSKASAANHT